MRRKWAFGVAAALSVLAMAATAADKKGSYVADGGVGAVDCSQYAEDVARARKNGADSDEFYRDLSPYIAYVSGFQTAYNRQTKETCNIFDKLTMDDLLGRLEEYCQGNPDRKFFQAMITQTQYYFGKRKRVCD